MTQPTCDAADHEAADRDAADRDAADRDAADCDAACEVAKKIVYQNCSFGEICEVAKKRKSLCT